MAGPKPWISDLRRSPPALVTKSSPAIMSSWASPMVAMSSGFSTFKGLPLPLRRK